MTFRVIDEVPVDPAAARVYAEGWQSWSPTTWYPAGARGIVPHAPWQHTMRFRPGTNLPERGVQGEGVLVVDPANGDPARCYGAWGADCSVPAIRARLDTDHITVESDEEVVSSEHAAGGVFALASFADGFAARVGRSALRSPPTVWCSWYHYFEAITAGDIEENLAALDREDLPVDIVQIDDGWSHGLGEWLRPAGGFDDLPRLVDMVKASGREVGLWLAPFVVGSQTSLAEEHPDWLVGDAGYNWGQDLLGLDLTHPGVRDYLGMQVARLRDLGVGYLKLDFLYAGAIPGPRHDDVSAIEAYRSGMRLIRDSAGPDVYLLGCGAPILPSVGLVDAMRVSPDTFHRGGEDGSDGLRGLMPLASRAWQQGRFWVNDADCLVARPTYALREDWARAVTTYGGLRSASDRLADLDDWGLQTTRGVLASAIPAEPLRDDVLSAGAQLASALLSSPTEGGIEPSGGRESGGADECEDTECRQHGSRSHRQPHPGDGVAG